MFLFLSTWRTSRGGLGASFTMMTKEVLLKNLEERKYWSQLRFVELVNGTGESGLLNSMSVGQFERCFTEGELTTEQVDQFFSVEVRKKYGSRKVTQKAIPKKELEVGRVYQTDAGTSYVYLGKVKGELDGRPFEGYLKAGGHHETFDTIFTRYHYNWMLSETTKNPPKFVSGTNRKFNIPTHFEKVIERSSLWRHSTPTKHKLTIEFLDVKQ